MSSKLFSQFQLTVPSQEKRGRSFWRDKLRWPSRSRESSRNRPQEEKHIDSESLKRHIAAIGDKEHASTIMASTPLISSRTSLANDNAQVEIPITIIEDDKATAISTDLWSAAYLEALHGFGDEMKSVILKGERIETLLTSLEQTNQKLAGDSVFRRGLQRLQAPLRNFKLALDLTGPLAKVQPTASTAVGVVSCVTTIAIAICGAEDSLNTQIVSMLEHVAIIDDCDTLGQKLDAENGIHKALVPVYKDLLNFYIAALDILTSKAFVFALVCDQLSQRLPTIVADFVKHAAVLRDRIGNATLELITDIKKLLQDNKIQKLLGVDKDKLRSEFHSELRELRASDACKWILADPKFIEWYDAPTSGQLVILGHMGCGKTVITAHVIEELIRLSKHRLPRPIICYHYCGNDERGKALYIYSSLILQLLDQQEGLKVEFDRWHNRTKDSERLDPAQCSEDLGRFLSTCVENLDRELFIVIDALDECDSDSRDKLIMLLDSLSKKTQRLKVFFSSRPQDRIEDSLQGATQIRWSPSRERDAIIVRHTVERYLKKFPAEIQSLVTHKLSESAQGSGIWVKLTVQLIQTRKINAIDSMKFFLADIPSPAALSQLYGKLFTHATGNDPDNEQVATSALQILAVARRPLSILELGWAVALNDPCAEIRTVTQLNACVDERRALNLLQPFLLNIDFEDDKKRQVRLVHQSLKDLILRDAPSKWSESQKPARGLQANKQRIHQRRSELEADLLHICVKYLLFDEFDKNNLFSDEQVTIQNLEEMPGFACFDVLSDDFQQLTPSGTSLGLRDEERTKEAQDVYYDPAERGFGEFYVYASCFWVDHFKAGTPELLPDIPDIVKLCTARSKRLQNWIEQNCRPDCTIMPRFDYNSLSQDPLTVVALHGPEIALKMLLEDDKIDFGSKNFLVDSVKQTVEQIMRWGDLSRLAIFFRDTRVGPEIRNSGIFHQIMIHWAHSDKKLKPWEECFDLIFDICDGVLVQEKWGNEFLCLAVSCGCLPMVERLFGEAARKPALRNEILRDVRRDVRPPDYHQSVGEAVWHSHIEVLRYLLKQEGIEVHLRHRDSDGYNVLHKAARSCNPEVMSLLISHFPEGVNQSTKHADTALQLVVFGGDAGVAGRLESAKILLMEGHADVRGGYTDEPSNWKEPLRMAARYGDVAMCRVLVEVGGADPRSVLKFVDGRPELMDPVDFNKLAPNVLETLCSLAGIGH